MPKRHHIRRTEKGRTKDQGRRERARAQNYLSQYIAYLEYCEDPDTSDNQHSSDITLLIEE